MWIATAAFDMHLGEIQRNEAFSSVFEQTFSGRPAGPAPRGAASGKGRKPCPRWLRRVAAWPHDLLEEVMKSLALKVQRFLVAEDGPTAVEYAVMLALIVIVCLTAIQAIGTNANTTFNNIANAIDNANTTGTP
jgi:pilus assembly protein Flp/PilA